MTKSEAGEEYWFKGKVTQVDEGDLHPYKVVFGDECFSDYIWMPEQVEVAEVVPEREKVTIPKEVADLIEERKPDYTLLGALEGLTSTDKLRSWALINGNQEKFARAWVDGYEIEKEPLYWVRDKEGKSLLVRGLSSIKISSSTGVDYQENHREDYTFTEKEIKDYDERYWAFAVPVEEEDE